MLILGVRLHFEWQGTAIHLHRGHLRAQTEGRRELDEAIPRTGALDLEHNPIGGLAISKICADRSHLNLAKGGPSPVGGGGRGPQKYMVFPVRFPTEKT